MAKRCKRISSIDIDALLTSGTFEIESNKKGRKKAAKKTTGDSSSNANKKVGNKKTNTRSKKNSSIFLIDTINNSENESVNRIQITTDSNVVNACDYEEDDDLYSIFSDSWKSTIASGGESLACKTEVIDDTNKSIEITSKSVKLVKTDLKFSEVEVVESEDAERQQLISRLLNIISMRAEMIKAFDIEKTDSTKEDTIDVPDEDVKVSDNEDDENEDIADLYSLFKSTKKSSKGKAKTKGSTKVKVFKNVGYTASEESLPQTTISRIKANIEAIRLSTKLEIDKLKPSKDEQIILNKFSGWGGLSSYFSENSKYYDELRDCLGNNFDEARTASLTAYYTPSYIIKDGMYKILSHIGFEKGRVVDIACGSGRFFTYMDSSMYGNSKLYCVDKDPVSLDIARKLHPNAVAYNCGLEDAPLKEDFYDLCICNPPYGDLKIYDTVNKDLNDLNAPIHDHALLKAYKIVREGGLIAFLTTSNTLDKENSTVLSYLSDKVDFLGAVRLPNNVFKSSGASVCTDIIVLRKGYSNNSLDWTEVVDYEQVTREGKEKIYEDFRINKYFAKNPTAMLGKLAYESSHIGMRKTLINSKLIKSNDFKNVLKFFPADSYNPLLDDYYEEDNINLIDENEVFELCVTEESKAVNWLKDMRSEEYIYVNNNIYQKTYSGSFKIIEFDNDAELDIIRRFVTIKSHILEIVASRDASDEELAVMQKKLNNEYDSFVKEYGYIGQFIELARKKGKRDNAMKFAKKMVAVMQKDIYAYNYFLALENRTEMPQAKGEAIISYTKADIFSKRILGKSKQLEEPTNIEEAIPLSYFMTGELSPKFISEKLNLELDEVINKLKGDGNLYFNFASGKHEDAEDFLSGYTKDKLRYHENFLERLEKIDETVTVLRESEMFLLEESNISEKIKEVRKNILMLEQNQPDYVDEVYFDISSPWIPTDVKRVFIADTMEVSPDSIVIEYCNLSSSTNVKCTAYIPNVLNSNEWGTEKMGSMKIVTHAINSTMPSITKVEYIDGKETRSKDPIETQYAMDKVSKWKRAFDAYISDKPELHEKLVDLYNEKMIRIKNKNRKNIILDPGTNEGIVPRDYQLLGTSMCIMNDYGSLIHFPVGSGKSLIMAMFMRMMDKITKFTKGRNHKGLMVVPNHLCQSGQAAAEYLKVYADAKILALTPSDFSRNNRRRVLSKIATNNWEVVIMPQSVFGMIPLKPETESFYCEKDIEEIEEYLRYVDKEDAPYAVSKMEKMLENKKAHLKQINDIHKDKFSIYFEDLGFDSICVDEAHHYKALDFQTRLQVAGVQNSNSKRARNLYNIVRYQRDQKGKVVFLTATPVSNTLGELYTFTRFLAPEVLEEYDVGVFDAWAATFADIVTNVEVDPTGQTFSLKSRLARFKNIPELMAMYNMFAYYLDPSEIKGIKIPSIANGAPKVVEVEPNDEMLLYSENLMRRWEACKNRKDKRVDNPLKITTDGRKSAYDHMLIDIGCDFVSPKLETAGRVIAEYYRLDNFSTHMVFGDLGCPKGADEYSSYDTLKEELIKNGVPSEEIAFIHDGSKDDEVRKDILNRFNNGVLRVLIGSTSLLGEGVNVQSKLLSLHHLCAPWKPASVKQREGRALRFGNMHDEVHIVRYVTKYSFDTFSWQLLEAKARFLAQLFSGKNVGRIADDLNADINDYAAAKASASGNPLILEQCQVNSRLDELKRLETNFNSQRLRKTKDLRTTENKIAGLEEDLEILKSEIEVVNSYKSKGLPFEFNGYLYRDKETILEILKDRPDLGEFGKAYGLPIYFDHIGGFIRIGRTKLLEFKSVRVPGVIYNRLESIKRVIKPVLEENKKVLENYKKNKANLEQFVDKVFEYRDELEQLTVRSKEIELELKKAEEEKNLRMQSEEVKAEDICADNINEIDDIDEGVEVTLVYEGNEVTLVQECNEFNEATVAE